MLSFFRQHKNKLLLLLIVILVLAAAYIFTEKPHTAPSPAHETTVSVSSANETASSLASTSLAVASRAETTASSEDSSRQVSSFSEESTGAVAEPHTIESSSEPVTEELSLVTEVSSVTSIQEMPVSLPAETSVTATEDMPTSLPEEPSAAELSEETAAEPSAAELSEETAAELSEETAAEPSAEPSMEPAPEPSAPRCTFSISCAVLTDRIEDLPKNKRSLVPADGILSAPCSVTIEDGDSVFDITQRFCQAQRIPFEFTMTPVYHTAYIEGIANLYEFDCGSASGWVYTVNGVQPGVGCSDYPVHDGDTVIWHYTCALGNDVN